MALTPLLLTLAIITLAQGDPSPACISDEGEAVDMFIIYKLPKVHGSDVPHVGDGTGYIYLDSSSPTFKMSSTAITDPESAAGRTLNQVYDQDQENSDLAYAFYNDQPPNTERSYGSYAHAKGALAFDKQAGFWLISSVPRFPSEFSDGYVYPSTGHTFGQMLICVTFPASSFNEIAKQLIYDRPKIFDKDFPPVFEKTHPDVQRLFDGDQIKEDPFSRTVKLISSGGMQFISFAKDDQYRKDLYHDLVAPSLKTSLWTETWQRGRDIGKSCTGKFTVEDIDRIMVVARDEDEDEVRIQFRSINDHSKFAMGKYMKSETRPYVCIGDINRQPSQYHRGGGTLCLKDAQIWRQYHRFVAHIKDLC